MSLARRIIPCLDTDGASVVKGVRFVNLRDAGDPAELAARYNREGADELVVLDIAASRDRRGTFLETIRRVAEELAIDAKRCAKCPDRSVAALHHASNSALASGAWEVFVRGGREATGRDAVAWAQEAVARGAGEILLTSMDRDGTRSGFDCALTAAVSCAVGVPVIASGGADNPADFLAVFSEGRADAALAASIFHDNLQRLGEVKQFLASH